MEPKDYVLTILAWEDEDDDVIQFLADDDEMAKTKALGFTEGLPYVLYEGVRLVAQDRP